MGHIENGEVAVTGGQGFDAEATCYWPRFGRIKPMWPVVAYEEYEPDEPDCS